MTSPIMPPDMPVHPPSARPAISTATDATRRTMRKPLRESEVKAAGRRRGAGASGARAHAPVVRPRTALGQERARIKDDAHQGRHQHGADDAEPLLVRRRVWDSELGIIAHRTTPLTFVALCISRARSGACGARSGRQLWRFAAILRKLLGCRISATAGARFVGRARDVAPRKAVLDLNQTRPAAGSRMLAPREARHGGSENLTGAII